MDAVERYWVCTSLLDARFQLTQIVTLSAAKLGPIALRRLPLQARGCGRAFTFLCQLPGDAAGWARRCRAPCLSEGARREREGGNEAC